MKDGNLMDTIPNEKFDHLRAQLIQYFGMQIPLDVLIEYQGEIENISFYACLYEQDIQTQQFLMIYALTEDEWNNQQFKTLVLIGEQVLPIGNIRLWQKEK